MNTIDTTFKPGWLKRDVDRAALRVAAWERNKTQDTTIAASGFAKEALAVAKNQVPNPADARAQAIAILEKAAELIIAGKV